MSNETDLPEEVANAIANMINNMVENEFSHFNPQLESEEVFRKRQAQRFVDYLMESMKIVERGFSIILQSPAFSSAEAEEIDDKLNAIGKDPAKLLKTLSQEDTLTPLAKIMKLPSSFFEKGLDCALEAFEKGEYEKANSVYATLCQLDPAEYRFSLGLGCCLMAQEEYQLANTAFMLSAEQAGDDAHIPLCLIVDCLIQINELNGAKTVAESVLEDAKADENSPPYLRAKEQLELIADLQK